MKPKSPLLPLFKEQLENESTKIASEHSLTERGDFLIWWYFLRLIDLPAADIVEIVCDGGNDLGIDAIYIDDDSIVHFYQFKNPVKLESSLAGGDVDKLLSGLQLILSRQHGGIANPALRDRIDEIYQIVPAGYRIHLVTSGLGMAQESKVKLDAFVASLRGSSDFFAWKLEDLEVLQDVFYQQKLPTVEQPIVFALEKQPPYQVRSANHDCYLLHTPGATLADLYEQHKEQLLQQNIRVFQGDKATNALIRQTATGDESANFFHYNNGVTFLCETAQWDQFQSKLTLHKAQVVNGGQTVRVLSRARADGLLKRDVIVPVRVITSQGDKQFASSVAVNLNNQNRIESSFLRSNDPQIVQLSHSMESLGWFLERRENELKAFSDQEKTQVEMRIGGSLANRVVGLREGMQAYVATYMRQPELAKKNPGRIFLSAQDGGVFDRVFSTELTAEKLINAFRLKRTVDLFVEKFMVYKRRKGRGGDWKAEYGGLLGKGLVDSYGDLLDQVVPQSAVFLCALLFEDRVRLRKDNPDALAEMLEKGDVAPLVEELGAILAFAQANPTVANKSWPTLMKSQTFFDNVSSFRKGQIIGE